MLKKTNKVLPFDERKQLAAFFDVLIKIDKRLNLKSNNRQNPKQS